jgi:hypothetical protein
MGEPTPTQRRFLTGLFVLAAAVFVGGIVVIALLAGVL